MIPREPNPRANRVAFELRSTGLKPDAANPLRSGVHTRGYLPHVKRGGSRYFVTFRLADSLPKQVLLKYQAERAERIRQLETRHQRAPQDASSDQVAGVLRDIERDYFRKLESYLDKSQGVCWLKQPRVAEIVPRALQFFEGERYRLDAWVVMPNHVHVVLWPMPNHTLSRIVQSWKRHTAREANKILRRTGKAFWQPEPYDHWIRDDQEHARCCRYVTSNPVKARLCATPEDWKWSSARRAARSNL